MRQKRLVILMSDDEIAMVRRMAELMQRTMSDAARIMILNGADTLLMAHERKTGNLYQVESPEWNRPDRKENPYGIPD